MSGKDKGGFSAADVDAVVGERIRRRRILTGLTQDQLGEALGVSYQQIQKYETGANRVSAGRLYLLSQKLDVSPAWFFDGLEDNSEADRETLLASSRIAIECVRNLSRIKDEKVRSSILTMIRTMADSDGAEGPSMARPGKDAAEEKRGIDG